MAKPAATDAIEALDQPESEEKEYRRELCLFNQIATITAHTLDLQEIINEVLSAVLEFFRIDAGLLLLWDRVRQRLTYAASRGFPQDYLSQLSGLALESLTLWERLERDNIALRSAAGPKGDLKGSSESLARIRRLIIP